MFGIFLFLNLFLGALDAVLQWTLDPNVSHSTKDPDLYASLTFPSRSAHLLLPSVLLPTLSIRIFAAIHLFRGYLFTVCIPFLFEVTFLGRIFPVGSQDSPSPSPEETDDPDITSRTENVLSTVTGTAPCTLTSSEGEYKEMEDSLERGSTEELTEVEGNSSQSIVINFTRRNW